VPLQYSYTSTPPIGSTACTEPQCLYSRAVPLLPLLAIRPVQSLSACTVELYLYSPYWPYGLYRATVPVQYSYTSTPPIGRTVCTEPQCLYKGALYLSWCMRHMQLKLVTCGAGHCHATCWCRQWVYYDIYFLMLVRVLKVLDSNSWHRLCHCMFHSPEPRLRQCPSGPIYGFATWYAICKLCYNFISCSYSTNQLHSIMQVSAGVCTESDTKLCSVYCHSSATGRFQFYIPYISPSSQVIYL